MNILSIINELNLDNWTNYKIDVLKKHSADELFKRVLAMAYDKAKYTYGITLKNINIPNSLWNLELSDALDILEYEFCKRVVTWHNAINRLEEIFWNLSSNDDKEVLMKIIDRNLKINLWTRVINKVFKWLITKPAYMRCGVFTQDEYLPNGKVKKWTAKNITINENQSAYIQLKADGTYREATVEDWKVTFLSRSGETYTYPNLEEQMSSFPEWKYIGELEVSGCSDRSEGNGLINSDDIPYDRLVFSLWDYIELSEYNKAKNKEKCSIKYEERFSSLENILSQFNYHNIKLIESYEVYSVSEALGYVSKWMNEWLEGWVLKDKWLIFKDGTSNQQLKLKLEIDVDVRITWFTEWTKWTAREHTFWAITFETDDWQVKWQTSWFTEAELEEFNNNRELYIGKIMVVKCNDITKWRNNDYYALSHPRYENVRTDKEDTDTLERIFELKQMAMQLK